MAASLNKETPDDLYVGGLSIPQVSKITGIPLSTLRGRFKSAGILRDRSTGVRMAARDGRLGSGYRGKTRTISAAHAAAISKGRKDWAEENAAGVSLKPSGYLEYTMGPNKFRSVHVVRMEERLGRPLAHDECVHHIDGNKTNNEDNNLALVTRSGHTRLHRREQRIAKGKV